MQLKKRYEKACNDYLRAFCEKYNFYYEPEEWIAGQVGTIIQIADFFFSMETIKLCVDNDVKEGDLLKWYDYTLEAGMTGFFAPNLSSWVKGCPRLSDEEISALKTKH